jgi:PPOX class probable F420-dependent enzyme
MTAHLSEKARAFLREKRFAVLATLAKDGSPQLTTMWYILEDDDTILMNTRAGRVKDRHMRRDPRIAICVAEGYHYVTLSGKVEIIDDPEIAQRDIFRLATRYHGLDKARIQMQNQFSKEHRVTLHLKPEHVIEYFQVSVSTPQAG